VVLVDGGEVDGAATAALRDTLRAERGAIAVFDFGPDIATLRASCEAETGLAAPVQPVWRTLPVSAG
jgi:N-methylhydantoinase B